MTVGQTHTQLWARLRLVSSIGFPLPILLAPGILAHKSSIFSKEKKKNIKIEKTRRGLWQPLSLAAVHKITVNLIMPTRTHEATGPAVMWLSLRAERSLDLRSCGLPAGNLTEPTEPTEGT